MLLQEHDQVNMESLDGLCLETTFSAYPRWRYDNGWQREVIMGGATHIHYVVVDNQTLRRYYDDIDGQLVYDDQPIQGGMFDAILNDIAQGAVVVARKDNLILVRFDRNGVQCVCPVVISYDRHLYL